jgi:hypothetical protein
VSASSSDSPVLAAQVAGLLERLSRLRGKRIFHPFGVGFAASLTPVDASDPALPFLAAPSQPLVRLSRAFGLPELLPDPCGLALRVPDAYGPGRHQDVLLVSAGWAPLLRHLPSPSRHFEDMPYSTLLPYRFERKLIVLGARSVSRAAGGPKLGDLRERRAGGLEFELCVTSLTGDWRPAGRLVLGERLPVDETERLDFDPTNTGGGLEPAGWLNRLRGPSYRRSQEGRMASG